MTSFGIALLALCHLMGLSLGDPLGPDIAMLLLICRCLCLYCRSWLLKETEAAGVDFRRDVYLGRRRDGREPERTRRAKRRPRRDMRRLHRGARAHWPGRPALAAVPQFCGCLKRRSPITAWSLSLRSLAWSLCIAPIGRTG